MTEKKTEQSDRESEVDEQHEETPLSVSPYFSVSPTKLVVMNISTLGIYTLFWFYSNWFRVKQQEKSNIYPQWRALFGLFFYYPLLKRINQHAHVLSIDKSFPPGWLTLLWVVLPIAAYFPEPYNLTVFLSSLCFVPVQITANKINNLEAPNHLMNDRFTHWNILAISTIGLMVVLTSIVLLITN